MQVLSKNKFGFIGAAVGALIIAGAAFSWNANAQSRPNLDIHFVPTPEPVVKRMLELAQIKKEDVHYDLGSGDGRIAISAVKDFGASRAVGIDLDPQRITEGKENAEKAGVTDKVQFREQNIFETDLREATVVSMYLLTSINIRMRPKLLKELRPGTRIVTHAFNMGDWEPEHNEKVNGADVYLFIVPATIEGKWEGSEGERKISFEFTQKYQNVQGTATVNGKSSPLKDAKLEGGKLSFTVDVDGKPVKYEGTVDGNFIAGSGPAKWNVKKTT